MQCELVLCCDFPTMTDWNLDVPYTAFVKVFLHSNRDCQQDSGFWGLVFTR